MKSSIAITLIIVGAVLILAPIASDQLHESRVLKLMSQPGITSVHLGSPLSEMYRFGCWLVGSVMIGLAVRCSTGSRRQDLPAGAATQAA